MPIAHLADRAVIMVAGPDAQHFLQNILTNDVDAIGREEARPGALLTPQGKIMFDFLLSRPADDSFRFDIRSDLADDLVRRLMLYRLRAKAQISRQDQMLVGAGWQDDSAGSQIDSGPSETDSTWLDDRRFPPETGVKRIYASAIAADADPGAYDRLRIRHGVAESGRDFEAGDAFPHDVLLDQNGGVGFRKGCFVGQEVVSRMQHRGTARRRVLIAQAAGTLPPAGTEISADDKPVGTLGTVDGSSGLAVARIDRAKDAMDAGTPLLAGGVAIALSIPGWARFTFPEGAAPAGEA